MRMFIFMCTAFIYACSQNHNYYLLPELNAEIQNQLQSSSKSYALRQVKMPEYLEQEQWFILQQGKVIFAKDKKWLSPLSERIPHLMYTCLKAHHTPFYQYPLPASIQAEALVDLNINALWLNQKDSSLFIDAVWSLSENKQTAQYNYNKRYVLANLSDENIIQYHQEALLDLCKSISQSINLTRKKHGQ